MEGCICADDLSVGWGRTDYSTVEVVIVLENLMLLFCI
jgi:hypothetical protein